MTGELTLLPPVARRSGRRRLGLVASGVLHLVLVIFLTTISGLPATVPEPEVQSPSRMVWTPPTIPEKVMPVSVSAVPIKYSGVPAKPAKVSEPDDKLVSADRDPTSRGDTSNSWRSYLPDALSHQADGLPAPAYVLTNLTPKLVTMLSTRGLAVLLAGSPPFRDAKQVVWVDGHPTGATRLPEAWSRAVARRGLALPNAWTVGLSLTNGDEVYLVPRPALDAGILAEQMRAARARGVPLEDLICTYGRLVIEDDDTVAFVVTGSTTC